MGPRYAGCGAACHQVARRGRWVPGALLVRGLPAPGTACPSVWTAQPRSLMNVHQASGLKVITGPVGRLLSRTGTRWGMLSATSRHSLLPPLYVLARHFTPERFGVLRCALFMLCAPWPGDG